MALFINNVMNINFAILVNPPFVKLFNLAHRKKINPEEGD